MTFRKGQLLRSRDTGALMLFLHIKHGHIFDRDERRQGAAVVELVSRRPVLRVELTMPLCALELVCNNFRYKEFSK